MQQIGNAVPPFAAAEFARHLLKLDGAFGARVQPPPTFADARLLGYVLTDATGMSDALKNTEAHLRKIMQSELSLA